MAFDPYRKWLGIPPAEQPPNHYRLLAISFFEDDADVIESASDQRMTHVRTFQTGKHAALSQRILNKLSAAKLCLLNPNAKAAYDVRLRRQVADAQPKRLDVAPVPPPSLAPSPFGGLRLHHVLHRQRDFRDRPKPPSIQIPIRGG